MRITLEDVEKNPAETVQGAGPDITPDAEQDNEEKSEFEMSGKEKLKNEKKKLSQLKGKKKLEYLWQYYKWVLAVLAVIAMIVSVVVTSVRSATAKELLYIMAIDAPLSDQEKFADELKTILDSEKNRNYVTIDTSCYTTAEGELDYNSSMVMSVKVAAQEIDAVILPESLYKKYDAQDMFCKVEDVMGKDFCEKHSDIVYKDGITLDHNSVLEKYGLTYSEPVVLAIVANSKHPENVKTFIQYLGY